MTNPLKRGQQVIYTAYPPPGADEIERGSLHTVASSNPNWSDDIFLEGVVYSYASSNFRPIRWDDVKPGDDVSFTIEGHGGFSAVPVTEDADDWPAVFDIAARDFPESWVLTHISRPKPKPALPTKNGSIIRSAGDDLYLLGGKWRWKGNGALYGGLTNRPRDWTLVHDAGKKEDK